MSKMKMTKLRESRFHVHSGDCFIDEDVNDRQRLGMAAGHAVGAIAPRRFWIRSRSKHPVIGLAWITSELIRTQATRIVSNGRLIKLASDSPICTAPTLGSFEPGT